MIIFVKVDTAGADAPIAKVQSGLDKIGEGGKKAGESGSAGVAKIGKAAGEAATALDKAAGAAKASSDSLGKMAAMANPFSALTAQFAREAEILERIRGPLREYRQDMEALEMLHKRGAVSAAEYETELQRLIRTQGTMQGPMQQQAAAPAPGLGNLEGTKAGNVINTLASRFGVAGQALASFATTGRIAAAVTIALTAEMISLGNQYIELANKAQKLTAKGGDVNTTLREQMNLSVELHGRLSGAMDLYDAVRDGTDELNLSQREQLELTRDIGAAVVASGKPIEQAGGLMSKLTFAFASGSIGGRELKGIMKEFPDIGAAFVTTLGHSRKELVRMANEGQLSADMLIGAFNRMGPEMLEKVGKKAETTGQMWGHFKDEMILSLGRFAESTGIFKLMGLALEGLAGAFKLVADVAMLVKDALDPVITLLGYAVDGIKVAVKAAYDFGQGVGWLVDKMSMMDTMEKVLVQRQAEVARAYLARLEAVKLLGVEEERNARIGLIAAAASKAGVSLGPTSFNEESANKWAEARIILKQAGIDIGSAFDQAATKAMSLDTEIEKIKNAKSAEKIADDAKKIWKELSNTNDVLVGQSKNWKALVERAAEFKEALDKIKADHAQFPGMAITKDDVDIVRGARDAQLELDVGLGRYGKTVLDAKNKTNQHRDALADVTGAWKQGQLTAKEYADAMKALGFDFLTAEEMLKRINAPQKAFTEGTRALHSLVESGIISFERYNAELAKLEKTLIGSNLYFDSSKGPQANSRSMASDFAAEQAALQEQFALNAKEMEIEKQYKQPDGPDLGADLQAFDQQRKALTEIVDLQAKYTQDLADLAQLKPELYAEDYARALDKIRAGYLSASAEGKTFAGGLEAAFIKLKQGADQFGATLANELVGNLGQISDAFVTMANGGEVAWSSMIDSMLQDLQRLILKQLVIKGIMALTGAPAVGGGLPGFATGGSFIVGGGGGTDSQPVGFMATPGERVIVQTPQQQSAGPYPGGGSGGSATPAAAATPSAQNLRITNVIDPSIVHAEIDSPEGERRILNVIRKNQSAIRGR